MARKSNDPAKPDGAVISMVDSLPFKQEVVGSTPTGPTIPRAEFPSHLPIEGVDDDELSQRNEERLMERAAAAVARAAVAIRKYEEEQLKDANVGKHQPFEYDPHAPGTAVAVEIPQPKVWDRVMFKSERGMLPAMVQAVKPDGACHLWVYGQISLYYVDSTVGEEVGQFTLL